MIPVPRSEPRGARRRGPRPTRVGLIVGLLAAAHPAAAAERFLIQGLIDAESWKTDDGSRLLSRNEGEPAANGALRLWAAADLLPGLQAFVLGRVEGGSASEADGYDSAFEQALLRYVATTRLPLIVEAGRMVTPVGEFSRRYLSSVNPLIGQPDTYHVSYPTGLAVSGSVSGVDYRVAVVDRPVANERYVPEGGAAFRPALTVGLTPFVGLRTAAYATWGPYLSDEVPIPPGVDWKDFDQRVIGVEFRYSRGHFDLHADTSWSEYEVPNQSDASRGWAIYVEPRIVLTPRLFAALRLEYNDYARIVPTSETVWVAQSAALYDIEVGLGYRLAPGLILKASYRRDSWQVPEARRRFLPDGYAVAAQLSYTFDVADWFAPGP